MFRIIKKEDLTDRISSFEVEAPLIARSAKPGQFVVVKINEKGERIPLTISDSNLDKGTIQIMSLNMGKTTRLMYHLKKGDFIRDIAGPLGRPSDIKKFGNVICIGGGVGIAAIMPIARELKNIGNYVLSIIGARTCDDMILAKDMEMLSSKLNICSDDGSIGQEGFVSNLLEDYLEQYHNKTIDGEKHIVHRIIAVGPVPMMKAVCDVTVKYGIKTIVSLNSIMVDGTGMCGSCRVEVDGKTKFACVDGPEFDGHKVNFDLLGKRLNTYKEHEEISLKKYVGECGCGKK